MPSQQCIQAKKKQKEVVPAAELKATWIQEAAGSGTDNLVPETTIVAIAITSMANKVIGFFI